MRIFLVLLLLPSSALACEKEIVEDVCPQREGADEDCDRRCREAYPGRTSSGCQLRSSGTLLSLFGIHSFVCKCRLPEVYCQVGTDPVKLSYSIASLQTHSILNKLQQQTEYCSRAPYQCSDSFTSNTCGWQRSPNADWFEAKAATEMPFAAGERPEGLYVAVIGRRGASEITLSTCDSLCSKSSVEISARLWRAPWVKSELCFKEDGATIFCAPVSTINGAYVNETIPETKNFQIYFKFSNVTEGDVIMLDDLNMGFLPCPENLAPRPLAQPKFINGGVERLPERQSLDLNEIDVSPKPRIFAAPTQRVPTSSPLRRRGDVEALRRRYCRHGECLKMPNHQTTHRISSEETEQCNGREGILKCKARCRELGEDGMSARCMRQREYPFTRRCVCQARKAPVRRIEGGSEIRKSPSTLRHVDDVVHRLDPSDEIENNEISANFKESPLKVMDLHCGRLGDDTQCDRHCKKVNNQSSGKCINDTTPRCDCSSSCTTLMCDFDGDKECGWTDLRLLSAQFNNISIAAKKDRVNRYGLSTLLPLTYSGLLRRGWIDGPVSLSVDIYPSEEVDLRICVDSLYKCQSQTVAAKTWNRVAAKIKVNRTDKIFLLIYNNSKTDTKTIAVDNISLSGGECASRRR